MPSDLKRLGKIKLKVRLINIYIVNYFDFLHTTYAISKLMQTKITRIPRPREAKCAHVMNAHMELAALAL
jgi:hypothetical protein